MARNVQIEKLEAEHGKGCVAARRSRLTGTLVQLYAPKTQSDDDGWFVVCRNHSACVHTTTRRLGEHCTSHPNEFCDDCRDYLERQIWEAMPEVIRRCFTGNATAGDGERCERAQKADPERYAALHKQIKDEEIRRIQNWGVQDG